MRRILLLVLAGLLTVGLTACKNKKESNDIITKMPAKPKKQSGPLTMSTGEIPTRTINWLGGTYKISIKRTADKGLHLCEDASGNKYYDNRVHLTITRSDGSTFVDKDFTKSNFSKYVPDKYSEKWGLTGFNFDTIDGEKLDFAIAIGSPDDMADNEFVPLTLVVDRNGGTSVTSQMPADDDEEDEE